MQEYVSNNNEYQIITKQKKTFIKKNSQRKSNYGHNKIIAFCTCIQVFVWQHTNNEIIKWIVRSLSVHIRDLLPTLVLLPDHYCVVTPAFSLTSESAEVQL